MRPIPTRPAFLGGIALAIAAFVGGRQTATAATAAAGKGEFVDVPLAPLGLAEQDLLVGGDAGRKEILRLNLPLVRRVVLLPEDVKEAMLTLSCRRAGARLDVLSRRTARNGETARLADSKPLQRIRLKAGEELALTVWQPDWHWNGGATLSGFRITRLGAGGSRQEAALPAAFVGGTAKTDLGTFSLIGVSNRDRFPEVEKRVAAEAVADRRGAFAIPGAGAAASLSLDENGLHFHTNGRANWDAVFGWAPALVFAPGEDGVYSLDGLLAFRNARPEHSVAWIAGRLAGMGGSLEGTALLLHRMLRAPAGKPVAGADYEKEPLARLDIRGDGSTPAVCSADVAAALRAWLSGRWRDFGLLLSAEKANGAPADVLVLRGMNGSVTIRSHPKRLLFDHPIKARPGVYATMRDGALYYGGQRLRLWSVVGSVSAERARRLGFNCKRVWCQGEFYTDRSARRGRAMDCEKGDGSKLDHYDRRMAALRENDLFVVFASTVGQGMPTEPLLQDDSWIAGGEDWHEWRSAVKEAGHDTYRLAYVDDRLWKIRIRHAENVFTHLNPYTGRRYAEEEAIVLVEISNEAGVIKNWLENGFDGWPAYFRNSLRRQWNGWLAKRYGTDEALRRAWSKLAEGESLDRRSVAPAPVLSQRDAYSKSRQADFVRFLYELIDRRNQEYRSFCRSLAPEGVGVNVVPFSFDSQYRPSIPWLYTNWLGDTSTVSMYFWNNSSMLTSPPGLYVLDSHRLEGRLSVIYETQRGRPSPYRAEYPYMLSVMTDWQDFDIVNWHGNWGGDMADEQRLAATAMPPTTSHFWTAVHLEGDPSMSAAVALAGRIYLSGAVGTARDPVTYTLGRDGIFSSSRFNGVGGREMSTATFTRGSRIVLEPRSDKGLLVDGKPFEKAEPPTEALATGEHVLWDWPNRRLVIDSPTAKVYAGKTAASHRFKDGITLSGFDTPFVSFALVSADGRPLVGQDACRRAYVSAVFDAKNTGFDYDYAVRGGPVEQAKAVRDRGRPPVVVDEVSYTLSFPVALRGRLEEYDFAMRRTGATRLRGENTVRQRRQTTWMGLLVIDSRGEELAPAVDPSTGVESAGRATGAVKGEATDPRLASVPNPLPDVSWGDNYRRAHRVLRDASFLKGGVSPEDLTDAAEKTIRIEDAEFMMGKAADAVVAFSRGRMTDIHVEFRHSPAFTELVAELERALGPPAARKLSDNAFERSEVRWEVERPGGMLHVLASETQGVVRVAYSVK